MLKLIFLHVYLLLPLLTLGAPVFDNNNPAITTITTDDGPSKVAILHCPSAESLTYDTEKMIWSAPNDFKSFDTSFVKRVQSFLGAQWTGAGLGQIFCVYAGHDKLALPIILAHNVISYEPKPSDDNSWGEKQGDHYNCISHHPANCPFLVKTKTQTQTLSEEFNSIKPGSIKSPD